MDHAGAAGEVRPASGDRLPTAGPGLVGAAVGAAMSGLRPVAEVPARHLPACLGLLAGHAVGSDLPVPIVLRVPCGPGPLAGWDLLDAAAACLPA